MPRWLNNHANMKQIGQWQCNGTYYYSFSFLHSCLLCPPKIKPFLFSRLSCALSKYKIWNNTLFCDIETNGLMPCILFKISDQKTIFLEQGGHLPTHQATLQLLLSVFDEEAMILWVLSDHKYSFSKTWTKCHFCYWANNQRHNLRSFAVICGDLRLFATFCSFLRPFATISDHLRYLWLFAAICDNWQQFLNMFVYFWRFTDISELCNNLGWFPAICGILRLCLVV